MRMGAGQRSIRWVLDDLVVELKTFLVNRSSRGLSNFAHRPYPEATCPVPA